MRQREAYTAIGVAVGMALMTSSALIFHTWASGIFGGKPGAARAITRAVNTKDCSDETVEVIEPFLIKYDDLKFLGYESYYPDIEKDTEKFIISCMAEQRGIA
jgi:hypothetical protein